MKLNIIKIGGNIIDDEYALEQFLANLAGLKDPFILVHGGGKLATSLATKLGIETKTFEGRRITDAQTLDVVVMVYAGLINKKITAKLQSKGSNAIGLCGADGNSIPAKLRDDEHINYGFVGDVEAKNVNSKQLYSFIEMGLTPVIAPITHDEKGNLLNTNADTIAASLAISMASLCNVSLYFCFEKMGLLKDVKDETSVISSVSRNEFHKLKASGAIASGMIPKLDNAFHALENGVQQVHLIHALHLHPLLNHKKNAGTTLIR